MLTGGCVTLSALGDVGDVADDIKADLVLLSTDCVHEESVNANLLAEFCPCATLLIP